MGLVVQRFLFCWFVLGCNTRSYLNLAQFWVHIPTKERTPELTLLNILFNVINIMKEVYNLYLLKMFKCFGLCLSYRQYNYRIQKL